MLLTMALGEELAPLNILHSPSTSSKDFYLQSISNINSNDIQNKNTTLPLAQQSPTSPHKCAGCEKPILDEFLSSVLNQWWHESCLKCSECGTQLSVTCYSREGKTFCKEDFYRYN